MKIVTNISRTDISIDRIVIPPKSSHNWMNDELTLKTNRKLLKLQSMGIIQVSEIKEEIADEASLIKVKEPEIKEEELTEEEIEELKAKGAKGVKNKKKSTRKKGE